MTGKLPRLDGSSCGRWARAQDQEDHEEADSKGNEEAGTERVGDGRDDADEPGKRATAESGGAEEESANPGGVLLEDGGEPGDEDRVLRSQTHTCDGSAEVQDVRRVGGRDYSGTDRGQQQPANGDRDFRKVTKDEWGNAAAKKKRAVEKRRRDDVGDDCDSREARFITGDPAAEGHFRADIEKVESEQRRGLR